MGHVKHDPATTTTTPNKTPPPPPSLRPHSLLDSQDAGSGDILRQNTFAVSVVSPHPSLESACATHTHIPTLQNHSTPPQHPTPPHYTIYSSPHPPVQHPTSPHTATGCHHGPRGCTSIGTLYPSPTPPHAPSHTHIFFSTSQLHGPGDRGRLSFLSPQATLGQPAP